MGATGRVGEHVVDVLREQGAEPVAIARSLGVDVVTGEGLDEALEGVSCIIDCATGASPDGAEATAFFEAAARTLIAAGEQAGVTRAVVVSIIGIDKFSAGYNAAKQVHERAWLEGPIDARILRAAQFHEFVETMLAWGRQGDVAYVPAMRTQLVAARAVAESLVVPRADGHGRRAGRSGRSPARARSACSTRRGSSPTDGLRVEEGAALGDIDGDAARVRRAPARPGRPPRRPDLRGWLARPGV